MVKQRAGPTPEQRANEGCESVNGDVRNLGRNEVIVSKFSETESKLKFPFSKLIMLRNALSGKAKCLVELTVRGFGISIW
jgi:hypothetical protein